MREIVAQSVRMTLAEKIVALYPRVFFEMLESMSALPANNESFPLLLAMQDVIDGHYDALELQLFDGTLQMALEAKLLDDWHYQILKNWVQKIEHEMEDTPVIERNINRTFYGFCYQESDQSVKCVIDAQYSRVFEQQQQHWAVGHLTAPIVQQQVWFEHFGEFPALRKRFKETMLTLENDAYFRFLQELKALPAAVSPEVFAEALVLMETEGSPDAVADLKRYGYRWNCL